MVFLFLLLLWHILMETTWETWTSSGRCLFVTNQASAPANQSFSSCKRIFPHSTLGLWRSKCLSALAVWCLVWSQPFWDTCTKHSLVSYFTCMWMWCVTAWNYTYTHDCMCDSLLANLKYYDWQTMSDDWHKQYTKTIKPGKYRLSWNIY